MALATGKRMAAALTAAEAHPGHIEMVLAPLPQTAKWLKLEWVGRLLPPKFSHLRDIGDHPQVHSKSQRRGKSL